MRQATRIGHLSLEAQVHQLLPLHRAVHSTATWIMDHWQALRPTLVASDSTDLVSRGLALEGAEDTVAVPNRPPARDPVGPASRAQLASQSLPITLEMRLVLRGVKRLPLSHHPPFIRLVSRRFPGKRTVVWSTSRSATTTASRTCQPLAGIACPPLLHANPSHDTTCLSPLRLRRSCPRSSKLNRRSPL